MPWKKITLDGTDIREGVDDRIQEAFVERLAEAGWPQGAFMYGNNDTAAEGYLYYFTPQAVAIAQYLLDIYGAVDCLPPRIEELTVLVKRTSGGRPDL